MMFHLQALRALEVLDSRGRPTVWAACRVNGAWGEVSVPSGASTGAGEALELRDGDLVRYAGLGCRRAVAHVTSEIAAAVVGQTFQDQSALDRTLVELDGTPDKSRLGANATLAASLAFARACAAARGVPLYRHFADIAGVAHPALPQLTVNLFSGGKHAGGQMSVQDVLVVPLGPTGVSVALERVVAVVRAAEMLVVEKYHERPLKADEGGLAPPFPSVEEALDDAATCIRRAGLEPGVQMALAIDVASSHFYVEGHYHLGRERLTSPQMIDRIGSWADRWPIVSVEDGLAEDDWGNWPALCEAIGRRALVLGDDLLCTNAERIRRAVDAKAANALLLKVNQVGTVSEAAEARRLAVAAGWHVTASARSGETEDAWLADLATGWAADQIKVGSVQQSERLAKYNRLLAIEAEWAAA
jgi:enolase